MSRLTHNKGLIMSKLQDLLHLLAKLFPAMRKPLYILFMKIAPPRIRRLCYFVIYLGLALAGTTVFYKIPQAFERILGGVLLVNMFGSFIVVGALVCAASVLPGIWWFERAGLYLVAAGIGMYSTTLVFLGASPLVIVLPIILILILAIRWLDIKEFLLAPRED
jgi:hypothetical protein